MIYGGPILPYEELHQMEQRNGHCIDITNKRKKGHQRTDSHYKIGSDFVVLALRRIKTTFR